MSSTITFIVNERQRSIQITKDPIEKKIKKEISDQKWATFCLFCKKIFGHITSEENKIDIVEEIGFDPEETFDDEFIANNSVKFITTIFKEYEKLSNQQHSKS